MRRPVLALILLAALPACLPALPPPVAPTPVVDACGAVALQPLVGQRLRALDAGAQSGPVRIIRPGQAVTMDYIEARLNVEVDARNRITRIACG